MSLQFNTPLPRLASPRRLFVCFGIRTVAPRREKRGTNYGVMTGQPSSFIKRLRASITGKLKSLYWASFVGTPSGETLLAGFYGCRYIGVNETERPWPHTVGVDPAGSCDMYELVPDGRLNDLAGRLVVEWGVPSELGYNEPTIKIRSYWRSAGPFKNRISPGSSISSHHFRRLRDFPRAGSPR